MQFDQLKRRDFITFLGGAAAAWPLVARAQQPAMPVVGFLNSGSPNTFAHLANAFRQGLKEAGYIEGQNVAIEYRWAESRYDQLPVLAADLVNRQVNVIAATGGDQSAIAAKAATTEIPIVFIGGGDPVRQGLVASLNQPGGNLTGTSFLTGAIESKRLGLLRELVPNTAIIGVLLNPSSPAAELQLRDIPDAARAIGQQIVILEASNERDVDAAFETLVQRQIGALLVASDPFFTNRRDQVLALAARYSLPTIYFLREFAAAGGLMSYGANLADAFRQVGMYAGRILKGEKPADLPVLQPTKFELVVNLKTASSLGLTVPPSLLALADEVIE
jgi:putative tryptophan/tyrosine transport system substrate-binding protein